MKYVDEFRDRDKATALPSRNRDRAGRRSIRAARPIRRSWKCAAAIPTRSSATASRDAAGADRTGARPWLPGLRAADGTYRRLHRHRRRPGVILTTFGDAMRVPGSRGSLLQAKANGADIRMVYSPIRCAGDCAEESGSRGGVLRSRLRNHDAVHRADGAGGGTRRDRQFLACSATTSRSCRRSRRSSTVPICGSMASSGPATCRW